MKQFCVAAVFSNHMVLQRDSNVKVFGRGEDGKIVTVRFIDTTVRTSVRDGKWMVQLPPRGAGVGYTMIVQCEDEVIQFEDIAIGEVWLAGGQSNMEWEIQNCTGGTDVLTSKEDVGVRFYNTPRLPVIDANFHKVEQQSSWEVFGGEGTKNWSAVGYFFGRKLAKELGVTVGIIGCNWGGTSASAWISEAALEEDRDLKVYLDDYRKAIDGKTKEMQDADYAEYEIYHNQWNQRVDACKKENPDIRWPEMIEKCGECRWPGPMNYLSPFRPSGLYETMVKRIVPYTLGGFIYYQGESDENRPAMYQKLLSRLIRQWREDWEDDNLPFLFVQLTMHKPAHDPDYKHWCFIREAQERTFKTVRNTGLAVIIDCGQYDDIHPTDKKPVGERLALQALHHVFHKIEAKEAFGPMLRTAILHENCMELVFDYAEDGFIVKGEVSGFELAGEDKEYHTAKVTMEGNRIYLRSDKVEHPLYGRYLWTNYGDVTVFASNGLPMAPFRSSYNDQSNQH